MKLPSSTRGRASQIRQGWWWMLVASLGLAAALGLLGAFGHCLPAPAPPVPPPDEIELAAEGSGGAWRVMMRSRPAMTVDDRICECVRWCRNPLLAAALVAAAAGGATAWLWRRRAMRRPAEPEGGEHA